MTYKTAFCIDDLEIIQVSKYYNVANYYVVQDINGRWTVVYHTVIDNKGKYVKERLW